MWRRIRSRHGTLGRIGRRKREKRRGKKQKIGGIERRMLMKQISQYHEIGKTTLTSKPAL